MTAEIVIWTESAILVFIGIAGLYYKIGHGKTNGNGKVSKVDFEARVIKCDLKFDRIHTRLDEQIYLLTGIKEDVGYLRGKSEN